MAEFNLEGLLGNVFGGGGGNYLDEYLTEDQKRAMQRNAMLAASAALLKAGGESTRRIGIGEALGGAFEAGQAGYEKAQTGALTQMALKQKLDEAKRAKALQERIAGVFTPQTAMPGVAPMPMPEVDTGVPPLPTSAGAAMPPAQAAATPMNPNVAKANQYREAARILAMAGQGEKAITYEELAQKLDPRDEVQGAPFEGTDAQGKPVLLQQMKSGVTRPVSGYGAKQGTIGQPIELTDAKGKPVVVQQMPDGTFRPVDGFTPKQEASTNEEKQLKSMGLKFTMANLAALRRAGAAPAAEKAPRTQQVQLEDGTIGLINMDTGAVTRSTVGGVEVKGKSEAPVAFSEASRKLNNLKGNLSAYKTEINSNKTVFPSEVPLPFGARIPLPTGEDTARLRGKYQSLLMGVKDLYELGALTGPDMGIISEQLTNPASFAGMFTSRDAMREQIKVLEDMAGRAEENLSVTYKRKIPAASTSGIPAEPGARPADIEKIINQYRRTR